MTEFEKNCYGMTEADIREDYMSGFTARACGLEMVVMGILSDFLLLFLVVLSWPFWILLMRLMKLGRNK